MKMSIKSWIYEKIQSEAFCKGKTIVWDKEYEYDHTGKEIVVYTIKYNSIVKETEKAVCVDCTYWYHGGRRVSFTEYTGYKVWIPKSAIARYEDGLVANF